MRIIESCIKSNQFLLKNLMKHEGHQYFSILKYVPPLTLLPTYICNALCKWTIRVYTCIIKNLLGQEENILYNKNIINSHFFFERKYVCLNTCVNDLRKFSSYL